MISRRPRSSLAALLASLSLLGACGTPTTPSPSTSPRLPSPTASIQLSPTPSTPPSPSPSLPSPAPPSSFAPPCGEADPTCDSLAVQVREGVDFTKPVPCGPTAKNCLLKVDIFTKPDVSGAPLVVMIPGGPSGPGARQGLWPLARYVAGRGAIVFAADYRSALDSGGGFPQTFADVACAIRFARGEGASLGGDPSRVVLVSHSFGGFAASVVALSSQDFQYSDKSCLAAGSGKPTAFAGVASVYTMDQISGTYLEAFLGGPRQSNVRTWAAVDIATIVHNKSARTIPVSLIAGTSDDVAPQARAVELQDVLRLRGTPATVTAVDGATHDSILSAKATVDAIAALAGLP